ncbi:MAG: APC family permease [Chloroflexi bacterium]|nr:APC family permease [Chloroflexota bacterium]
MNPSDPIPPYEVKEIPGGKPGSRHFRLVRGPFRRLDRDIIKATEEAIAPKGRLGRAFRWVRRVLFGVPLTTAHEVHERLNKVRALAILASDNISSSAYATEEMLRVLVLAGAGALALANPIAIPIVIVLAIVVTSYQQIVRAYVSGGGSYIAARENLGTLPGLTAAAALLTEYVLTVSVSIAAGVAAITSIFPGLFEHRVTIALLAIAVLTIGNLRGIRESGTIFAAPTYIYVFSMLGLLAYGVYRSVSGTMPPYTPPTDWVPDALTPLTILLVLRAFASGAVALTGTEAVSNAVPVFKPPESRNARITLIWMGILFGTIFLGITFLASQLGLVPDPDEVETINSQLTRLLVGQGWYYFLVQSSTAIILLLAANTAFTGFPRLASVLANDDFLPHQFSFRGDRLAFSTGIVVLATIASLLVIAFGGSVTALIPLYTVGVFVAFTLAQAGMVMHWRRLREPRWQIALVINGIGAVATGFVAIEVAAVKFVHGAWIALILTLLLVLMMLAIQNHYKRTERELRLSESDRPLSMATKPQVVIVPVPGLNKSVLRSLTYARSISTNVTAVHVTDDLGSAERLREQWQRWASDIPLVIIESPYRNFTGPLLTYIDLIDKQTPDVPVTVVLPEFFPKHWWENLLHSQRALLLKAALLARPNTVVTDIPYHLRG